MTPHLPQHSRRKETALPDGASTGTHDERSLRRTRLVIGCVAAASLLATSCGGGDSDDGDGEAAVAVDRSPVPAPPAGGADDPAAGPSTFEREFAETGVTWHRWGDEAFALAERLNRPVFALIGYAACPWCAKMRRESFEDPAIAELINARYVPVLVDAELRPDINRAFMRYLRATKNTAGWPLCAWLTPDRLPISAGTYFPPESGGPGTGEVPGFRKILEHVSDQWNMFPTHYREQTARDIRDFVEKIDASMGVTAKVDTEWFPDTSITTTAYSEIASQFDPVNGGFASSPKFLFPMKLDFLLAFAEGVDQPEAVASYQAEQAVRMVQTTLDAMIRSSIRDHLGGGFFRYSLDTGWNAPNFEKSLSDQALMAATLFRAARILERDDYRQIGLETLAYVESVLKDPDGGFRSGEAAESPSTGTATDAGADFRVGAHYTWTSDEIDALLAPDDLRVFRAVYDIRQRGNIPPGCNIRGDLDGRNTLYATISAEEAAKQLGMTEEAVSAAIGRSLQALRQAAEARPRPLIDEKVVLPWNAAMVTAYLEAYRATQDPAHLESAQWLASFLADRFFDPSSGRLLRVAFANRVETDAIFGDYASLIEALLDVNDVVPSPAFLDLAARLQTLQNERFTAPDGRLFETPGESTPFYLTFVSGDAAEPSPYSISVRNMIRLAKLVDRPELLDRARGIVAHHKAFLSTVPSNLSGIVLQIDALRKTPAANGG